MKLAGAAVLATLALAAAGQSATAETYEGAKAYRTAVFWSPADRLWTGGVEPQSCLRNGRTGGFGAAARLQAAMLERSGELIGEIRATPVMAPRVIAQARSCATEADSATTTYALLTDAERNWAVFSKAFTVCMSRNNSAQYVGSMTLWIDQACIW